jgi:hypothetical protein
MQFDSGLVLAFQNVTSAGPDTGIYLGPIYQHMTKHPRPISANISGHSETIGIVGPGSTLQRNTISVSVRLNTLDERKRLKYGIH